MREMHMTSKIITLLLLLSLPIWSGCAGVSQGRPARASYEDPIVKTLIEKYSKPDAIPADQTKITEKERNQILDELIFLADVNYYKFEAELYQARAFFDTTTDMGILGLGAAGALITVSGTQAIISAISGGIGGTRTSISKNYFHEQSTQALIAKMQSARKAKLELIHKAMTLNVTDYSLSRGLGDLGEYYNAGTIIGALQNIVADAGAEAKKADEGLKSLIEVKYTTSLLRDRINRWLDSNLTVNVPLLKKWLLNQVPPITLSPATWVIDPKTTVGMLNKFIKENNIPE
jgi:hypothetical protein